MKCTLSLAFEMSYFLLLRLLPTFFIFRSSFSIWGFISFLFLFLYAFNCRRHCECWFSVGKRFFYCVPIVIDNEQRTFHWLWMKTRCKKIQKKLNHCHSFFHYEWMASDINTWMETAGFFFFKNKIKCASFTAGKIQFKEEKNNFNTSPWTVRAIQCRVICFVEFLINY